MSWATSMWVVVWAFVAASVPEAGRITATIQSLHPSFEFLPRTSINSSNNLWWGNSNKGQILARNHLVFRGPLWTEQTTTATTTTIKIHSCSYSILSLSVSSADGGRSADLLPFIIHWCTCTLPEPRLVCPCTFLVHLMGLLGDADERRYLLLLARGNMPKSPIRSR